MGPSLLAWAGGGGDQRSGRAAGGAGAVGADVAVLASLSVRVSARGRVGASRMERRRRSTIGGGAALGLLGRTRR